MVLIGAAAVVAAQASTRRVKWLTYDTGLKLAAKTHKPVLISFYADNCFHCRRMDHSTYADPQVVNYINRHFVPVRVYPATGRMVALKYNVRALPTTIFLEGSGRTLTSIRGFISPPAMRVLLQYVGTRSYRRITFLDYVRKNFPHLLKRRP
jgi:thioredoxin-related protein